jgi:hypothetical protein
MIVKEIRDEDFTSYKKPSMVIGFPSCTFKCEREYGQAICQNSNLVMAPDIRMNVDDIVNRYVKNPITKAIIMAGLEPFDSWYDLHDLIIAFRKQTEDDIVIYTGYKKEEISYAIDWLHLFPNTIVKFGRFIPNQQPHFDEILGIYLASDNQYAERIS